MRLMSSGDLEVADAAHRELLVAVPQEAAADVHVGFRDRLLDVGQREAEGEEARRVGLHVHFLEIAAEGHDVGHARHLAQHAHDVPLHFGAQLVEIVPVAREPELVHLAERRRFGRELRRRAGRQLGGGDPLQDDRPRREAAGRRRRKSG